VSVKLKAERVVKVDNRTFRTGTLTLDNGAPAVGIGLAVCDEPELFTYLIREHIDEFQRAIEHAQQHLLEHLPRRADVPDQPLSGDEYRAWIKTGPATCASCEQAFVPWSYEEKRLELQGVAVVTVEVVVTVVRHCRECALKKLLAMPINERSVEVVVEPKTASK
jgi:hypothetical protein